MKSYLRALAFLTVMPLPFVQFDREGRELTAAAGAFPLVGATIGLCQAVLAWLLLMIMPSAPAAALLLAAGFFLTRGLHLDGLADTADGLIGTADREKALRAMSDSAVGVMGVAVVLFLYLFKFVLLAENGLPVMPAVLFFMPLAGRWAIVLAGSLFKPARDRGLGDLFLSGLRSAHFFKATAVAIGVLIPLFWLLPPLILPVAAGCLAALTSALLLAVYANRRLGGLTGDILGAVNEMGEAVFLLSFYFFLWHGDLAEALLKAVQRFA